MSIISDVSNREAAILGLLYEAEHYGYEIEKIIEERGMRNWTEIGFSSIYYVLKRLEGGGLIQSKMVEVEGKPSRKVYTITEVGKKTMKEKVTALLSKNIKLISPFDLGIAYIGLLEPKEALKCLELYLESLGERLSFLEDSQKNMEELGASYHVVALFSRPLAHLKTERSWVEQFMGVVRDNGGG